MTKMIFSLTPNPALDLGGLVEDLKPNEKSYVRQETRTPGGNSINAARIIKRLNGPVVLSGFLGGSTGDEIASLLKKEHLNTQFIRIRNPSRINVTVSNEFSHSQTRLSFPGPAITNIEKQKLFKLFKSKNNLSFLLFGGSLPKGFTPSDIIHLIGIAESKGIKSIVDCPGSILAQIKNAKLFLIKPNLEEFQELTNSHVTSIGTVIEKSKTLLDRIQYVCVSSIEGGTLLVSRNNIYFGRVPKINILSTVGAGDSMVGAMVSRIYKNAVDDDADILKWGLASAAATLASPGMDLGHRKEILKLYQKVTVRKINSV